MSERESTTFAFLFTDIEGSTRLWEAEPEAMSAALSAHDATLHDVIASSGGQVFKTAGDAFFAVFPRTMNAIEAAVRGQRALASTPWTHDVSLRVRMAIHEGVAESRGGDYFGPPLNRLARLLATAHGGQIVISQAAHESAHGQMPEGMSLRRLGEFALKDLPLPEGIYQIIAPGLRHDFLPLRTPERLLRNVPHPANPLIGREASVSAARAAFGMPAPGETAGQPGHPARLLTLTGPGGTGKSRLALHLARELGVELADGAAFVPLASLTDPALVPAAIASALDLGESGGELPRQLIFSYLRDRQLLLVLDNFEQILGASNLVAELLAHAPQLRVLATSRERLCLRGEREIALPPLDLPEIPRAPRFGVKPLPLTAAALEQICGSPAVQLFLARARSIRPDFTMSAENAETIAEICIRLDGLPLAIELAAARLKLLAPRALLERLDQRLDLLSRGARDLPDRQKTMRDTIAWSYDLLQQEEQRLFARLSVFVGGASLDAVEAVIAEDPSSNAGVDDLELVESLADKSLVRIVEHDDEPRVIMFETIRDFARERFAEHHDRDRTTRRHADYFLARAETLEPRLVGPTQSATLGQLDRDRANLRAAVAWLREHGEAERALRLSSALWRYWWLRGDMSEGRALLDDLLAESPAVDPAVRAKALNGGGVLAESLGDRQQAARLHQESLQLFRETGDLQGVAWSLNNLGVVAINLGNLDEAQSLLLENLAVAEQTRDDASIATALIDLGQVAHYRGSHDQAVAYLTRSLALFRALGDESQTARSLNNLGTVAIQLDELDQAQDLLTESLALHRAVGDRQSIASTLNNLAEVVSERGDPAAAMDLFQESYLLALDGGNRLNAAIALENLAALTLTAGDRRAAQMRFRDALLLFQAVADGQGIASSLINLASIAAMDGHSSLAATMLGGVAALPGEQAPVGALEHDPALASLRSSLGANGFDAAWRHGRAMSLPELIETALNAAPSRGLLATL